jgi:hypothetical protein
LDKFLTLDKRNEFLLFSLNRNFRIFAAMKRLGFVLVAALPLVFCLLLGGCGDNSRATALLSRADSLMAGRPDSALQLLDSCEAEVAAWPESQQMRFHLLQAKAQNKAYVPFTSDSVMTVVSDYYDRHGTSNEQVEVSPRHRLPLRHPA